jgi:multiple sugar transport system permease protein
MVNINGKERGLISYKTRRRLITLGSAIFIIFFTIWTALPLYWLITTALKTDVDILASPPYLIPASITLQHFSNSIFGGPGISDAAIRGIMTSLFIAGTNTALSLIISLFTSFSIVRFRTGGGNLRFWIISQRFLPPIIFITPMFIMLKFIGLFDSYGGLILVYFLFNIPFAVLTITGFLESASVDMEESAMVDGCSRLGAFLRITARLVAPGLVVTALFCFLFAWNEYLMAYSFAGKNIVTLAMIIPRFRSAHDVLYGEISAAATVAIVPAIILALLLQRYVVRGLTFGAIKG